MILMSIGVKSKQIVAKLDTVVIKGVVSDSIFNSTPDVDINVKVWVSSFSSILNIAPTSVHEVVVKNNKPFSLKFKAPSERFYIHIGFNPNAFGYWSFPDNMYIMDADDNISVKLNSKDFVFYGSGAEKLNCQSEIYHHLYKLRDDDNKFQIDRKYIEFFARTGAVKDSLLKSALLVVDLYSVILGKDLTEVMRANCYGNVYYNGILGARFYGSDVERLAAFLNSSNYDVDTKMIDTMAPTNVVASPIYLNYILEKIIAKSKDPILNIKNSDQAIRYAYDTIISNFNGVIREKLLTLFVLTYGKKNDLSDYFVDISGFVSVLEYKVLINNFMSINKKNQPFYSFSMEDEVGNVVKLNQFNDKIVILDLWYTGCVNCVNLTTAMKPVFEKYKDNSKVVFISVCVDKNKATWLKSLATGQYSHPDAINLFDERDDPMNTASRSKLAQAYNLTAYPTVFIIKNGKMFYANPADARRDEGAGITKIIENALHVSN